MKVKRKLPLLMILLVVIPLLILSSIISIYMSRSSLEMRKQALSDVSESIANYLEEFYKTQMDDLEFTAQIPAFAKSLSDPSNSELLEPAQQLLNISAKTNSVVNRNSIIDLSGNVVASSDPNYQGTNVRDSSMFKTLIEQNKDSYNEVVDTPSNGSKCLALAIKIYDTSQKPIGILNRNVSIGSINQQISQRKVGDSGYVYILDSKAKQLSTIMEEGLSSEESQENALNNDADLKKFISDVENNRLKSNTGFFTYNYDGTPVIANYEKIPTSGWVVVVCMTQTEVFKEANTLQTMLLLTTLTITLVALFIGIQLAKTITNPLTYPTEKIKQIQHENFSVRCEIPGDDEFHELADNINQMTETLEISKHELVKTNELLKKSAYIDGLTNIPNRKSIYHTMDTLFRKYNNQALFLFDLNGFKTINDTFGHHMGDAALNAVAKILKGIASDNVFPARLGGDEFLIFINNYSNPKDVLDLAENILRNIENIKNLREHPVNLSASLGITFLKDDTINRSQWIRQADEAMYDAKHNESSAYAIYEKEADLFHED